MTMYPGLTVEIVRDLRHRAGQWLRVLRQERGLSQRQLARKVGAENHTFVSEVELGRVRIPPDHYRMWAVALGVDRRQFVRTLMSYYEPLMHVIVFGRGSVIDRPVKRAWRALASTRKRASKE